MPSPTPTVNWLFMSSPCIHCVPHHPMHVYPKHWASLPSSLQCLPSLVLPTVGADGKAANNAATSTTFVSTPKAFIRRLTLAILALSFPPPPHSFTAFRFRCLSLPSKPLCDMLPNCPSPLHPRALSYFAQPSLFVKGLTQNYVSKLNPGGLFLI